MIRPFCFVFIVQFYHKQLLNATKKEAFGFPLSDVLSFGILIHQRELKNLTGIKPAFAGYDEAKHAYQCENVQIMSAEHLDAENDGGEGGVGGTAEKSYEAQCGSIAGVETDEPAEEAAEGGAYCKGGDDLTTLEACSESYGSKDEL